MPVAAFCAWEPPGGPSMEVTPKKRGKQGPPKAQEEEGAGFCRGPL